jgi:hypothetical protein
LADFFTVFDSNEDSRLEAELVDSIPDLGWLLGYLKPPWVRILRRAFRCGPTVFTFEVRRDWTYRPGQSRFFNVYGDFSKIALRVDGSSPRVFRKIVFIAFENGYFHGANHGQF